MEHLACHGVRCDSEMVAVSDRIDLRTCTGPADEWIVRRNGSVVPEPNNLAVGGIELPRIGFGRAGCSGKPTESAADRHVDRTVRRECQT
jgi:hypothetical protein